MGDCATVSYSENCVRWMMQAFSHFKRCHDKDRVIDLQWESLRETARRIIHHVELKTDTTQYVPVLYTAI